METRIRVLLGLALLIAAPITAQTPPKSPNRTKQLTAKIADSAVTTAATMAADSLLGKPSAVAAGLLGAPTCPPGTTAMPAAGAGAGGGAVGAMATSAALDAAGAAAQSKAPSVVSSGSPGGFLVGIAKRKLMEKKADTAKAAAATNGATAATPQVCVPAEQAASMQAAQAPQPASVNPAASALPAAGRAMQALGSRFRRGGENKESMMRDLQKGRLQLKGVKFAAGSDTPSDGFESSIAMLAEALAGVDGQFTLYVPTESNDKSAPDADLAQRRAARLAAHLQLAGITESRVTVRAADADAKPAKAGDVRAELLRVTPEQKP